MASSIRADALIKRLTSNNVLDADDIQAIKSLTIHGRSVRAQALIVADRDRPSHCCVVINGFVYRSKTVPDGQRQILSIHISGDIPDLQSLYLHVMDHDVIALTDCTLGFIGHDEMRELCAQRPNVAAALWRETLVDAAIFREWIVNVGRRHSASRLAHLLLEIRQKLDQIGRVKDGAFELPMTQAEVADCLGISTIHVNRIFQLLQAQKLLAVERKEIRVLDQPRLEQLGQFDALYLHQSPVA